MSANTLPRDIMGNTLWSFIGTTFEDQEAFSEEVRQYHIDITGKDTWEPDLVVLPAPRVVVAYEYWRDEMDDQIEGLVELESANGRDFSALNLLFNIHNAVVAQLCDDDHHFFEGLSLEAGPSGDQPPQYVLYLGS